MKKIVLASGNDAKLEELQSILIPLGVELAPQSVFKVPAAVEDGASFVENAIIKARHASRLSGLPALADDSGLVVDALDGEPGIYSARYAGHDGPRESSDAANNALLLARLQGKTRRSARFQCAIALLRHPKDPLPLICLGSWEGSILTEARGHEGFGYDPLFQVPGHDCSSAELAPAVKNAISHRAQALQQLQENLPPWL